MSSKQNWTSSEKQISSLQSDEDIHAFLKASSVKDHFLEFKNAKNIENPNSYFLKNLIGSFKGPFTFLTPSKDTKEIQINFDPVIENNSFGSGSVFNYEIYKNGERISNSSSKFGGDGTNALRNFSSNSKAILINLSDDQYIQLYYLSQNDCLIGNYYEREKSGEYKHTATLRLDRI